MWKDQCSIAGLGRNPEEGNGNPLQYSCLENPMDRGAWQAIVHGVPWVRHDLATKPTTILIDTTMTSPLTLHLQRSYFPISSHSEVTRKTRIWRHGVVYSFQPYLEKEMATHSSILAWKTPWTEEPGRLQSMGSWRVGHDWVTSPSTLYMW